MNIGIVVEGQDDYTTYPTLIQRIRNDMERSQVRECGGKSRLKNGFLNFLREFQNPAWQIEIAVVIRDSDCEPPQPIENQLRHILNLSRFKPQFRVEFFAIPCTLESWLVSDVNAIRTVAAQRGHADEPEHLNLQIPNAHSPEDKELFSRVLSLFGLPATPAVYQEVATIANLDMIGDRCRYFREFSRRIKI
jgi:Domain of unknown function (DUF4276)